MTASVLIIAGHVGIENLTADGLCDRDVATLRRGTGTRGERDWTADAAPRLADALRARGVEVAATDATYSAALYGRRWDLALALHLQRDRPSARAFAAMPDPIGVCGVPYISLAARAKAAKWLARFDHEYPIVTGIPATPEAVTANMTQHYAWDWLEGETPAVLAECGNADVDAAILYEPQIARVVSALALITCEYLEADLGLTLTAATPSPSPTPPPFPLATFPVPGAWEGDPNALESAVQSYTEGRAPAGWGRELAGIALATGIRADVAAAQAMHETGRFRFNGTDPVFSAKPEWNNYGGIKTTDGKATARFDTVQHGIYALCAHIAWYALPDHSAPWCTPAYDPRHFGAHRDTLHVLADYGGGVWNTSPRPQYGSAVARHLAELRARIAAYVPPAEPPPPPVPPAPSVRALVDRLEGELASVESTVREIRALTG